MDQYKQAPMLVKIRTIAILIIIAFICAALYEIAFPQRTHALVLDTVHETTLVLTQVATPAVPASASVANAASSPAPRSVASPKPPTTTNSSDTAQTTSPSSLATNSVQPIENARPLIETHLQKIYFSKAKLTHSRVTAQQAAAMGNLTVSSPFFWLQTTSQGWKLFGAMWYLWIAPIAELGICLLVWRRLLEKYIMLMVFTKQHILYAK